MTYTIKPNPNSRYMQAKPKAQQKAIQRNGTKFTTVEYKGRTYNGLMVSMDKRKGIVTMKTTDSHTHTLRMLDITRIKAQGLIMEY